VIDKDCHIELTNSAAIELIQRNDHIRISNHGRLQLTDELMHATLKDCVSRVASRNSLERQSVLCHSASKNKPFARISLLTTHHPYPEKALVLVSFVERPRELYDHSIAAKLYRLSRAELAVCEELISGHTVKQISTLRGTSTETVRYQLKSIFSKTETKSQHALVSLLLQSLRVSDRLNSLRDFTCLDQLQKLFSQKVAATHSVAPIAHSLFVFTRVGFKISSVRN